MDKENLKRFEKSCTEFELKICKDYIVTTTRVEKKDTHIKRIQEVNTHIRTHFSENVISRPQVYTRFTEAKQMKNIFFWNGNEEPVKTEYYLACKYFTLGLQIVESGKVHIYDETKMLDIYQPTSNDDKMNMLPEFRFLESKELRRDQRCFVRSNVVYFVIAPHHTFFKKTTRSLTQDELEKYSGLPDIFIVDVNALDREAVTSQIPVSNHNGSLNSGIDVRSETSSNGIYDFNVENSDSANNSQSSPLTVGRFKPNDTSKASKRSSSGTQFSEETQSETGPISHPKPTKKIKTTVHPTMDDGSLHTTSSTPTELTPTSSTPTGSASDSLTSTESTSAAPAVSIATPTSSAPTESTSATPAVSNATPTSSAPTESTSATPAVSNVTPPTSSAPTEYTYATPAVSNATPTSSAPTESTSSTRPFLMLQLQVQHLLNPHLQLQPLPNQHPQVCHCCYCCCRIHDFKMV